MCYVLYLYWNDRLCQVRGDLVNVCIPGDVLRVVGIVKAMQVSVSVSVTVGISVSTSVT